MTSASLGRGCIAFLMHQVRAEEARSDATFLFFIYTEETPMKLDA